MRASFKCCARTFWRLDAVKDRGSSGGSSPFTDLMHEAVCGVTPHAGVVRQFIIGTNSLETPRKRRLLAGAKRCD